MSDGTTILFGLPGVAVREVQRVASGRVAHVLTADPDAAACPVCGVFSQVVRQRRTTRAPRPRLRRGAVGGALAQAAVPLCGAVLSA